MGSLFAFTLRNDQLKESLVRRKNTAPTLTKNLIVERIHYETNYSLRDSKDFFELVLEDIKMAFEQGEDVMITGFGKWHIQAKRQRRGRNPVTGKPLDIAARKIVTFKPAVKLRRLLNPGSSGQ